MNFNKNNIAFNDSLTNTNDQKFSLMILNLGLNSYTLFKSFVGASLSYAKKSKFKKIDQVLCVITKK